jgi:hypothetical protein
MVVLRLMKPSGVSVSGRPAPGKSIPSLFKPEIGNPSIYEDLEAQSLLGVEGFAEGLRHLVLCRINELTYMLR